MVDYSTLARRLPDNVECFVLESVNSTNDYLVNLPISSQVQVCIAREQSTGKGQYQRHWLSKRDSSVLLSLRYPFSKETSLNGLSLVIGLSVLDVLSNHYKISHLKLKWPNDVYFKDQKLAGILIENSIQNNVQSVVIGLGLNHYLGGDFKCETPWTDLSKISKTNINLVDLQENLIKSLLNYCRSFEKSGIGEFRDQWLKHDYLIGRQLGLNYQSKRIIGIAKGINDEGALLIESNGSIVEAYSSEHIRLI